MTKKLFLILSTVLQILNKKWNNFYREVSQLKCLFTTSKSSKYPINVALSDIFLADPIFYKTPVKTFILPTKLSSPTQKALYSIAFLCVVVVVEMNCELTLLISLVIPKIYTLLIISKKKIISIKALCMMIKWPTFFIYK